MDISTKRKLKEVVRGLIGDGFGGTQSELVKILRQRGFKVTQSTISRMMTQIGVIKESGEGQSVYKIRSENKSHYRGSLSDLVMSIRHNSANIVVKTKAGSAMFVAGFLDHECKNIILGTVAGDDTIIVIPADTRKMASTVERIAAVL